MFCLLPSAVCCLRLPSCRLPTAPASCRLLLRGFLQLSQLRVLGGSYLFLANEPDPFCQAEQLQHSNAIPVEVNLIPRQAVFGGSRMSVMIVVPAFAKGKQRHPPAIG